MKTEPSPAATPDATPKTGEAVLAAYLAEELPKARQISNARGLPASS